MIAQLLPLRSCPSLLHSARPAALLAIAALHLGLAPAWASPPPGQRLLLFVGSNTLGEQAVPELAKAWLDLEKHATNTQINSQGELIYVSGTLPNGEPVYVEIHATGSGDAFKSLLGDYAKADARCDIGMSSRRATDEETEALKEKWGSDLHARGNRPGAGCEHPVAMDGLAIVVHASNPLNRISFSEIRDIYSRKLLDWKDTRDWQLTKGAPASLPIQPLRRREPSGTLDFFKERLKPDAAPMNDVKVIPAFMSSGEMANQVALAPGGIAFVGESYAAHSGVKRLQVYDDSPAMAMTATDAVFPDRAVVRMGIYPLSRLVYLYTEISPLNAEVQPFIRFALSEEGQTVIADKGHLVKVEGTNEHITQRPATDTPTESPTRIAADDRKKRIILRLHGSNTVGAECAVNLAFNYFTVVMQDAKSPPSIEDFTTSIETPEGEKAFAHDVMCDVDGDGTWETIEIRPTGSSDAFRDLLQGTCDVGMSSRPISEAEKRDLFATCGNLALPNAQFALGLDGMAIIVSNDNPVSKLTVEQVRQVFLGEIRNWTELGGPDRPIALHARPNRSGTYKYFCDSVLLSKSVPDAAHRHAENAMLAEVVAKDPASIGFVPMTNAAGVKVLKIGHEGSTTFIEPTDDSVRQGRYPAALCRYVYLYVPVNRPESPNPLALRNWTIAREFAELSQSWRGQAVVASSGFVTEATTLDEAGETHRIAGEPILKYLHRLRDLERRVQLKQISITPKLVNDEVCPRLLFEFNEGTLTAESKNIIDKKLEPWLKMYPSVAKDGLIAEGWADSVGTDEACQKISLQRAETVASYIRSVLGCTITAIGKGKSSDPPNTSEANKQLNRRVVIKRAGSQTSPSVK